MGATPPAPPCFKDGQPGCLKGLGHCFPQAHKFCSGSAGLGRGRLVLAQSTTILRNLEQEEPFDLSQKRNAKGPVFQSNVDSTRGCLYHEEEEDGDEDNCYEVEPYSPSPAQESQQLCTPEDLSTKQEQALRDAGEGCRDQDAPEEQQEESGEDHEGRDMDCDIRDEHLGSGGQDPSFSDYLYLKHRDEGLKELLERKMEKQAVLLGI